MVTWGVSDAETTPEQQAAAAEAANGAGPSAGQSDPVQPTETAEDEALRLAARKTQATDVETAEADGGDAPRSFERLDDAHSALTAQRAVCGEMRKEFEELLSQKAAETRLRAQRDATASDELALKMQRTDEADTRAKRAEASLKELGDKQITLPMSLGKPISVQAPLS